jgi:flagellar basal body-associated protein FliL
VVNNIPASGDSGSIVLITVLIGAFLVVLVCAAVAVVLWISARRSQRDAEDAVVALTGRRPSALGHQQRIEAARMWADTRDPRTVAELMSEERRQLGGGPQ